LLFWGKLSLLYQLLLELRRRQAGDIREEIGDCAGEPVALVG
jgi:hypothetical protein